jgi:serine/threonine protein kinase
LKHENTPASKLGRLELRDKLGSGSFATIYLAFDPLLERDVTVKVFPTAVPKSAEERDHFSTEIKALARLSHPRIVPIYDAGREGKYHYISMGFIKGRTLAESRVTCAIDFAGAARIVVQIAEALTYAHGLGVVHRDIKPSNIVLDDRGDAHLIDFGLAHRGERVETMSPGGLVRGTPAYLAPEQARGVEEVPQPANDQYSLGVVLYELLCGRPPFQGPPLAVLVSALRHEPPRPATLNPAVPAALEAICLRALAKRPEDRYPSCQALADDLQRWLRTQQEASASAPASGPRPQGRASRWARQARRIVATFVTIAVSITLNR